MDASLASGTVLHGRYTITSLVKAGVDGALYLGSDALAAAKLVIILEGADPSPAAQASFQEEYEVLAALEHPSLPVVLDSFIEPSGRQYLVLLGYVEPNLGEALSQKDPFIDGQVLDWFDRILDAVEYLHAQRPPIVHGHISPSHIVITVDGTPHLTGLVDVEGIDNAGVTSADAPFLAPEQHQGRFDERSDIYGLGATLYALLTGKAPADAVARTQGAELVPPRQANRALPEGIDAAILRAMQLDPQQRYTGVPQLRQALAEGLQPGAEAGKDFWGALRGPARRRLGRLPRVLLGIGGTLAILLLAAGVLWRLGLPSLGLDNAPMPTPSPASIATAAMPPTSLPEAPTEALPVARPSVASPSATPAHVASTRAAPPTTAPTSTTAVHPTPTVRWIAGPPASATPRWFPAPTLDSPGQGECTGSIEFTWTWPYALADDEYFDLQVYRIGTQPEGIAWCKERRYRTTGLLLGEGQYYWRVQVIRGQAGQVQGVVSDPSAACLFTWRAAPAR